MSRFRALLNATKKGTIWFMVAIFVSSLALWVVFVGHKALPYCLFNMHWNVIVSYASSQYVYMRNRSRLS